MDGATISTINIIYGVEDGRGWSAYIVDLLSDVDGITIDTTEMDSSGWIDQAAVARLSQIVLVLATPGLCKALVRGGSSSNFDQIVSGYCTDSGSSSGRDAADVRDPVILFLCGTALDDDFLEADASGTPLKNRLRCLNHWSVVQYNQCEKLTELVGNLLTRRQSINESSTRRTRQRVKGSPEVAFKLVPEEVKCEEETMVVLSFEHSIAESESEMRMRVEITGQTGPGDEAAGGRTAVVTRWLNSHTVYFMAPPRRAGFATVSVFNGDRPIGSRPVMYRSSTSDATVGIIQILLHQTGRLCDQLLVQRRNVKIDDVDRTLSAIFNDDPEAYEIPAVAFERFMEPYRFLVARGDKIELELPTALHFAAKYGFGELASRLLDLPDAQSAYCIMNVGGMYPEDVARAGQHNELGSLLENFHVVVCGFTEVYRRYRRKFEESTNPGNGDTDDGQEEYMAMDKSDNTERNAGAVDEEEYLAMDMVKPGKSSIAKKSDSDSDDQESYMVMDKSDLKRTPKKKKTKPPEQELYLSMDAKHGRCSRQETESDDENYMAMDKSAPRSSDDEDGSNSPTYEVVPSEMQRVAAKRNVYSTTTSAISQKKTPVSVKTAADGRGWSKEQERNSELINTLDQWFKTKHDEMPAVQFELLFREWQMRYQDGKSQSFQQKKVQMAKMRTELQRLNIIPESDTHALQPLGGQTERNPTPTIQLKLVDDDRRNGVPQRPKLKPLPKKGILSPHSASSPRSSYGSSCRDSVGSRSSACSTGVENDLSSCSISAEDKPADCPETPPVPSRTRFATPVVDECDDLYLPLKPGDEENEEVGYLPVVNRSSTLPIAHSHGPIVGQKSMPERPCFPPTLPPRKVSCPAVVVSGAKNQMQPPPFKPRGRSPTPRPLPSLPQ